MVAYGPAVLDAAARIPIDPAVKPDRAGHRDGRGYTRRRADARGAGALVPLWNDGVFRDHRGRHLGLLLTRLFREFDDGSDQTPAGYRWRLLRQPRRWAAPDVVGAWRIAQRGRACRDRRAVSADRPERSNRDREESGRTPDADHVRLHPLPRRLPD